MPVNWGFEPERSLENAKAQVLIEHAAQGRAGSAKAEVKGVDRRSMTGTSNPSLSVISYPADSRYNT